jgi:hypothetical protein
LEPHPFTPLLSISNLNMKTGRGSFISLSLLLSQVTRSLHEERYVDGLERERKRERKREKRTERETDRERERPGTSVPGRVLERLLDKLLLKLLKIYSH